MGLPNVNVKIGNGSLGRINTSSDNVAGLILTGKAIEGKLELNKVYQLSSMRDLVILGITTENNPFVEKELKAFFEQTSDGAELHLLVVSQATTMTMMCDSTEDSPIRKLIDHAGGRIRLVGINKLPPADYEADVTQGIDDDAITAVEAAQKIAESYAKQIKPFRLFLAAPCFKPDVEKRYQPRQGSCNRVAFVLASDDVVNKTAAVGLTLGRAASIEPQQSIGRVKDGAVAKVLYLTNGKSYLEVAGIADNLHDAGYIIPRGYPTKNGAYFNGNPTAAPRTDDYSEIHLGRIMDKAVVIAYDTYISEILENIKVEIDGTLSAGACISFASMLENALATGLGEQVSGVSVSVDTKQNILSTGTLEINCKIVPLGTLENIDVNMSFSNPALNKE